jgi:hypothetical protein
MVFNKVVLPLPEAPKIPTIDDDLIDGTKIISIRFISYGLQFTWQYHMTQCLVFTKPEDRIDYIYNLIK